MKRIITQLLAASTALLVVGTVAAVSQSPTWILSLPPAGSVQTVSPDAIVTAPQGTFQATVTDLRYYISEIELITRDRQVIPLKDVYVLVDLANRVQEYELGAWPAADPANIAALRFHIGVDQQHNHLDPTTYPPTHPLAPQNPTMHWGWAAGYRFCTFEGKAGALGAVPQVPFEIHAVGNDLYTEVEVPTTWIVVENGRAVLRVGAHYDNLFTGIDAQWGPIEHGNGPEAVQLMRNFAERVFVVPTSVASSAPANLARLFPQVASHDVWLRGSMPWTDVQVFDITGTPVQAGMQMDGLGTTDVHLGLQKQPAGVYVVVGTDATGQYHRSSFLRVH